MLRREDISKTKEIKIKFKENGLRSDFLISHLEILGYSQIKKRFGSCKKLGIYFDSLVSTLFVLPIIGFNTISSLTKSNELHSIIDKDLLFLSPITRQSRIR